MLRNYFKLLGRPDSKTLERLTQEFPGQPDTGRIFAMTQARLHAGEEERFIASESRRPRWHYAATIAAALTFVIGSAAAGTFLLHPPAQPEQPALEAQAPAETTSASSETTSARAETTTAAGETTAEERTETTAAAAETAAEMTEGISTSVQEIVEKPEGTVVAVTTPVVINTTPPIPPEPAALPEVLQEVIAPAPEVPAETEQVTETPTFRITEETQEDGKKVVRIYADHGPSKQSLETFWLPTYLPDNTRAYGIGYLCQSKPAWANDPANSCCSRFQCWSDEIHSIESLYLFQKIDEHDGALFSFTDSDRYTVSYSEVDVGSTTGILVHMQFDEKCFSRDGYSLYWYNEDYAFCLSSLNDPDMTAETMVQIAESLAPSDVISYSYLFR